MPLGVCGPSGREVTLYREGDQRSLLLDLLSWRRLVQRGLRGSVGCLSPELQGREVWEGDRGLAEEPRRRRKERR